MILYIFNDFQILQKADVVFFLWLLKKYTLISNHKIMIEFSGESTNAMIRNFFFYKFGYYTFGKVLFIITNQQIHPTKALNR